MSIFDINGAKTGSNNGWNYSDPNKPDYKPQIQGTVVQIKEVQSVNFMTKKPEFWPDGNPKLNVGIVIQDQNGTEYDWIFSPKSAGADALAAALGPQATSMLEVAGKVIQVTTWEPQNGGKWAAGNPRPWQVQVLGQGQIPYRGTVQYQGNKAGQQPQQQVQQQPVQQYQQQPQQQQAPRIVGQFYEVPTAGMQQQQYQQPVQQAQPMQQQPMNEQVPVQVYGEPGQVYDQDIPF